jgi:hypothetical protein
LQREDSERKQGVVMDLFDIITILITLLAVFSDINFRYLRLPSSIGLMLCGMVFSLALIASRWLGLRADSMAQNIILHVDFHRLLLNGMLGLLLFAGALTIDLNVHGCCLFDSRPRAHPGKVHPDSGQQDAESLRRGGEGGKQETGT